MGRWDFTLGKMRGLAFDTPEASSVSSIRTKIVRMGDVRRKIKPEKTEDRCAHEQVC